MPHLVVVGHICAIDVELCMVPLLCTLCMGSLLIYNMQ